MIFHRKETIAKRGRKWVAEEVIEIKTKKKKKKSTTRVNKLFEADSKRSCINDLASHYRIALNDGKYIVKLKHKFETLIDFAVYRH